MRYMIAFLLLITPAMAQVPMTTDNRSLGPGTYEEMTSDATPPSDGYRKGWQSSKPGITTTYGGATGTVPLPNPNMDVPDD
jgi:hypothetical protein